MSYDLLMDVRFWLIKRALFNVLECRHNQSEDHLMTDKLHPSILSNPMMLMADLGMRALDITVGSSNKLCDGVDRLTRATASCAPTQQAAAWSLAATGPSAVRLSRAPAAAESFKTSTLDPLTRGWVQWMVTMGAVASLGAGRGFGSVVADENVSADRGAPLPPIGALAASGPSPSGNPAPMKASRPSALNVDRTTPEHALATGESRLRRSRRRAGSR